jgi:hypothetical protein
MQRFTALLFTLLLAGAVAYLITVSRPKGHSAASDRSVPADAGADAEPPDAAQAEDAGDGGEGTPAEAAPSELPTDAGTTLLSGQAPPALPADAPKKVRFGVVLVQYRGAQGAMPGTRTKDAALTMAKQLAEVAKMDFKAAIARGDKGSTDDLGYIPRGVLEPAPDYALFSLPKGGVSDPVDTPRGFWIAHRIE